MLSRIYGSEGGPETLDVLMKYLYAIQFCLPVPTPNPNAF